MIILCDTCSILMVIRIAPDMFIDEKFGCSTIPQVHAELFKNQRFKTKYPWRNEYKSKIKTLGTSSLQTDEIKINIDTIHALLDVGIENTKTGRPVDVSYTDKHIIACAAANKFDITSGDINLLDLAEQQFEITNISPLALVNNWIEDGLITWDKQLQMILEDWDKCGEMAQPKEEIGRFQKITGFWYVGS